MGGAGGAIIQKNWREKYGAEPGTSSGTRFELGTSVIVSMKKAPFLTRWLIFAIHSHKYKNYYTINARMVMKTVNGNGNKR